MVTKTLISFVVFLAVLSAATLWRAARNETRAEADFPPSGRFIEVGGTRVHYLEKGKGPTLVLIHGASGNLRDMSFSLVDRLADRYRVIAFDRPGLGYTDLIPDMSISGQARLLSQAAAQLGAEAPILVGQSYGGAVAKAWALDYPATALVTIGSPSLPWDTPLPTLYKVNTHPVIGPVAIPLLAAWVPESYVQSAIAEVFLPQDEPEGYADHIGAPLTLRRVSLRANAQQRASLLSEITALEPRWDELTLPFEMVHGTVDTTVGLMIHSDPLSKRLPNAHLTALPGIGHMPHHAAKDSVIEAINRAARRAGLQ